MLCGMLVSTAQILIFCSAGHSKHSQVLQSNKAASVHIIISSLEVRYQFEICHSIVSSLAVRMRAGWHRGLDKQGDAYCQSRPLSQVTLITRQPVSELREAYLISLSAWKLMLNNWLKCMFSAEHRLVKVLYINIVHAYLLSEVCV